MSSKPTLKLTESEVGNHNKYFSMPLPISLKTSKFPNHTSLCQLEKPTFFTSILSKRYKITRGGVRPCRRLLVMYGISGSIYFFSRKRQSNRKHQGKPKMTEEPDKKHLPSTIRWHQILATSIMCSLEQDDPTMVPTFEWKTGQDFAHSLTANLESRNLVLLESHKASSRSQFRNAQQCSQTYGFRARRTKNELLKIYKVSAVMRWTGWHTDTTGHFLHIQQAHPPMTNTPTRRITYYIIWNHMTQAIDTITQKTRSNFPRKRLLLL